MTDAVWHDVSRELDRWQAAGRRVQLWLRDDDAIAPCPQLDRLVDLSERFAAPILLAVIPLLAEPALAARLLDAPLLVPCQHGAWHRNHAPAGEKKTEFGGHRPLAEVRAELVQARDRLRALFGKALLPVFVPPWNRIDAATMALLPELGFTGLSCFRNARPGPAGGPAMVNTDIDIIDWHAGRVGRSPDALATDILALLRARRLSDASCDGTLGLLLHHRDHDAAAWAGLDAILSVLTTHPAVTLADPRRLFSGSI